MPLTFLQTQTYTSTFLYQSMVIFTWFSFLFLLLEFLQINLLVWLQSVNLCGESLLVAYCGTVLI